MERLGLRVVRFANDEICADLDSVLARGALATILTSLVTLGERERGTARLEEAVANYRATL